LLLHAAAACCCLLLLLLCRAAPGGAAAGVRVLAQLYGATRIEARLARYLQVRGLGVFTAFQGIPLPK
jgi:hypothetical protein